MKTPDALYDQAVLLLDRGRPGRAAAVARRALAALDDEAELDRASWWKTLALTQHAQSEGDAARRSLEAAIRACDRAPGDVAARLRESCVRDLARIVVVGG